MKRKLSWPVLSGIVLCILAGAALWMHGAPDSKRSAGTRAAPPAPAPVKEAAPSPASGETARKAPFLRFTPRDGLILAYRFSQTGDLKIDFGPLVDLGMPAAGGVSRAGAEDVRLQSSGVLFLKFYADGPGNWRVAARIEGLDHKVNGAVPPYAQAVSHPFAFRFTPRGYLNDFKFVEGIPGQARDFLRNALAAMQTGLPVSPKTAWRTREIDAAGPYRAQYRIDADPSDDKILTLIKEKDAYAPTRPAAGDPDIPSFRIDTRIDASENEIRILKGGPWILSVHQTESTVSETRGRSFARGEQVFTARWIEATPARPFPDRFGDFLALMEKDIYKASTYYTTDPALDRIGRGLSLAGALDRYFTILASDRADAMMAAERFLINYLRLYPDACGELIRIMDADPDRERFDGTEHLTLWYIIARTGHAEAQQYVADAASMDNRYSMLTRMRAVAYMHDFEHPEPFLAEALRELAESIPPEAADPDARDLRAMAVLALGGLGSDEKTNRELKPEIGRMLEERLATARDPAEIQLTLSAVGNYGGADAIDAVAPYLADPDPGIRQSAYKALRRMEDPEAASLLTAAYARETDPRVLASAARTIAEMPPCHRTVAFARNRVFDSDNAKEQEHLVRLLGKTLNDNPENETALRSFLQNDPDPQVKMEVYRYIAPEPDS